MLVMLEVLHGGKGSAIWMILCPDGHGDPSDVLMVELMFVIGVSADGLEWNWDERVARHGPGVLELTRVQTFMVTNGAED
ncbi:unnamed protein product [Arctogadus glacialis]